MENEAENEPRSGAPRARLGDRTLFPALAPGAYLNHAGVSPPSTVVRQGIASVLDAYARGGSAAVEGAVALRGRLRTLAASLLGVDPADVAITSGVTHGVQAIALSMPWRSGDRVVLLEGEFPANVTPWQRAADRFDLQLAMVPVAAFERSTDEGMSALDAELRRGARLVAVSAVQFRSGLRMPVRALAEACHRRGAELFVDAIQALGAVPLDARSVGVDYAATGAHKWLMGVEGAGFLYVRPDRAPALRPALAGWLSHQDAAAFLTRGPGHLRYDRPLRAGASVFEASSSGILAQAALAASLGLLLDLGIEAIHAHVNRYLDRLEPLLLARGFRSWRAPVAERRSCILAASPPSHVGAPQLREALARRGVVVAIPDGLIRWAPHWPNDADRELGIVADALDDALR